jgi:ATP-dependent Clp protease ATP-binding subunit ClpA
MFERFTTQARLAVVGAQSHAGETGSERIGTEHLLLALFDAADSPGVAVLRALGADRKAIEDALTSTGAGRAPVSDAAALATLGIDLDEVRRQVEDAFGPGALDRTRAGAGSRQTAGRSRGHIPFDRTAKKALELALREAVRMKHTFIGTEHLLLGLLHAEGGARAACESCGVRLDAARVVVEELVRGRRAG